MLQWSRERFSDECHRLVDAIQQLSHNQDTIKILNRESHNNFLSQWSLEHYGDGINYLRHPPVQREIDTDDEVAASNNNQPKEDEDEETFYDETIFKDDPGVVVSLTENADKHDDNESTITTEWHFSIVYSDTWKAPILYFTVEKLGLQNGSPCYRFEILKFLEQCSHSNRINDSWDFLSYDEHPVSGVPSFFLHPCQTLARLSTLVTTNIANDDDDDNHRQRFLLSWMSMILPSVGYAVPSQVYRQLEELYNIELDGGSGQ